MTFHLHRHIQFHHPREEVFDFFSQTENLNRITPPWLDFTILTSLPIQMTKGTEIDCRLKLYGIPVSWKTSIDLWDPPVQFIDRQVRGPYRQWIHTHRFYAYDHQTLMEDHVAYQIPGWVFAPLIQRYWIRHQVESIFDYRESRFRALFSVADTIDNTLLPKGDPI